MMGAPFRLVLAAFFVACGSLGIFAVQRSLVVPPAQPLPEDIHHLPLRLDKWQGQEQQLDSDTFVHVGADVVVERVYHDDADHDDADHDVRLHVAVFSSKPDDGVYHAPTNCYPSSGWTLLEQSMAAVPIPGHKEQMVNVSTWQKKEKTVHVVYWYRMGDYSLFERVDMGKVRWALGGRKSWPPLIKVLLETSASDKYASKVRILDVAASVQTWLEKAELEPLKANQP